MKKRKRIIITVAVNHDEVHPSRMKEFADHLCQAVECAAIDEVYSARFKIEQ